MSKKPDWKPSSAIAQWFEGKDLAELDIIEQEGRSLYPDAIKQREPKTGKIVEQPVRLRVPNAREKVRARREAVQWACKILGEDLAPRPATVEGIQAVLGRNYFTHLDNICLLSLCTFEFEEPHARYGLPEFLDESHTSAALYDLYARLDWWAEQEDPRIVQRLLDEETVMEVAASIAKAGHTGPLLAIDGLAQPSCVLTMARLLTSSRTPRSSSPSLETSTED